MSSESPWGRHRVQRLVTESVVIVFSVLVAFGVDAWWDARLARSSARDYVRSVEDELDIIRNRVERSVRLAGIAEDAATVWLEQAPDLSSDSLNALLGSMVMWATADLTVPSVGALLNSGAIDLIEDPELRGWIQAFPTEVRDFEEEESGTIAFIDQAFVPYLADRGVSLGRADPLNMGFIGRAPPGLVRNLVHDWGFESLVIWRATKARDVKNSAARLLRVMDSGRQIVQGL